MAREPSEPSVLRFGVFQLDLKSGEVRKAGSFIKLPPQPFKVLAFLASRPNEVVTREELRHVIWDGDTFVDFDKGLNFCIKQIRAALGDDAETPRYIETLPRRGYRFIGSTHALARGSPTGSSTIPIPGVRAHLRWLLWCSLAAISVVAALAARTWLTREPRLTFQQRDWILIAHFENRTGESIFEGTLESALEREISNSSFINVVPRVRVEDVLLLMKERADTPVDASLGREICLRDGGIRALLTGRIEKIGPTYALSTSIVNPADGRTVASVSEEARSQDAILFAVRRLSDELRKALGENLRDIQASGEKLERVTTPSLRALQLYSRGMALVNQYESEQAAAMLEQALHEDPQFASAHVLLAHCYLNLGRDEEAAEHYQRAFALANTTSDRERYFILGSYYGGFLKDHEKAIQKYKVLVQLYPDDFWGTNNLAFTYEQEGLWDRAIPYIVRRAELRPNDLGANESAVQQLVYAGRLADARPFLVRSQRLAETPGAEKLYPWGIFFVGAQLLPASAVCAEGDLEKLQTQASRQAQLADSRDGQPRDDLLEIAGISYLTLGRLEEVDKLFQSISNPLEHNAYEATLAWVRGDWRALREYSSKLRGAAGPDVPWPPMFMARAVLLREAREVISDLQKRWDHDNWGPGMRGYLLTIRGDLALAQGERARAIPLLQEGIEKIHHTATITFFLGSMDLANAWEQQGDSAQAIRVLEQSSQEKNAACFAGAQFVWQQAQFQLAQLYRKVGREADARRSEDELRKLLAYADPDHPIVLQLQGLQAPALAESSK